MLKSFKQRLQKKERKPNKTIPSITLPNQERPQINISKRILLPIKLQPQSPTLVDLDTIFYNVPRGFAPFSPLFQNHTRPDSTALNENLDNIYIENDTLTDYFQEEPIYELLNPDQQPANNIQQLKIEETEINSTYRSPRNLLPQPQKPMKANCCPCPCCGTVLQIQMNLLTHTNKL